MRKKTIIALVSVTLCFLSIAAQTAFAATSYTLKGYGYGHGIGLCQWGARGRAASGQNYEEILKHYYSNTSLVKNYSVPNEVRVRLFGNSNLSKAYVEANGSSVINIVKPDGTFAYQAGAGKHQIVPISKGILKVVKSDGSTALDNISEPFVITSDSGQIIVYDANGKRKHTYKGSIYVYSANNTSLYLVNYVDFEPGYLEGLGEVPSSWPYDALYSQAIAARTYALKSMKPTATFDLYDDTRSQVYVGIDKINETSNGRNWGERWAKAVSDTAKQVITYDGQPIAAYYHSSCGGQTENVELAWPKSKEQPYLRSVSDIDSNGKPYCMNDGNKSFSWSASFSISDFEKKLGLSGISSIEISQKGVSPRIVALAIKKQDGSTTKMSGQDFRTKLGLKSAWVYQMGGTYFDVPLSYWAFSQIEYLSEKGVVEGFSGGSFRPSAIVTRAQFVKMLAEALNINPSGKSTFNDTSGHWAEPYIAALNAKGIVGGFSNGSFRPDVMITRAEICTIIARAKGLTKGSQNVAFSDISDHWARPSIEAVATNGIVTGYADGTFRANVGGTRAEVAVMIYRMLNAKS
jgi:SpoIID/LytB domain protein